MHNEHDRDTGMRLKQCVDSYAEGGVGAGELHATRPGSAITWSRIRAGEGGIQYVDSERGKSGGDQCCCRGNPWKYPGMHFRKTNPAAPETDMSHSKPGGVHISQVALF